MANTCATGCGSRFEFVAAYGDNKCIVRPTSQHPHTTAGFLLLVPYRLRGYVNATSLSHEESVSWCSRVRNPRQVLQRDLSRRRCFQGDKELQTRRRSDSSMTPDTWNAVTLVFVVGHKTRQCQDEIHDQKVDRGCRGLWRG